MASELDIPLHGPAVDIVRGCKSFLKDVLLSKYGCVATICNIDFENDYVPEKSFETTVSGVLVSVRKADLSKFHVDAVVNAANEHLQHGGGLAQALSKAGGPNIQHECDSYIKRRGVLRTGDAIMMDAGLLPCKKIIHAVGPRVNQYHSSMSDCERLLKAAISNSLARVNESSLRSVAIPAISSGLFGYPLPQCADTIVTAVKQYCENSPGLSLKEIYLVNNDDKTVKEMERACYKILAIHPTLKSAASTPGRDAKTSALTARVGNVLLTLKRGRIEDEETDVIVNTTSKDCCRFGQISSAILNKAGPNMEQDLRAAFNTTDNVIVTKGHNLQCSEVYHTLCTYSSKHIIFDSVLECLKMAAKNSHQSISFPAIGTGGLGFSKKEVAQIMKRAVTNFAQKTSKKMEVYFVIYPSDMETYKAFEEQMESHDTEADPSLTQVYEQHDFHGSRTFTPQISLRGPSEEATREAEQWLTRLLFYFSGTIFICNNFISHFGKEELLKLSQMQTRNISIEEFIQHGCASIAVHGSSHVEVVVAGLQVEAMLCNIQKEVVKEVERGLEMDLSWERTPVSHFTSDIQSKFRCAGLQILKMEMVKNNALTQMFELKKKQLVCYRTREMIQCIPVQFCNMVSRIGFHADFARPKDPAYGEGIYFAGTVKKAMEVWHKPEYVYHHFVMADVLIGNSCPGERGLILPPPVMRDPLVLHDSLSGGNDISVIFSGYQALPTYIITCKELQFS